MHLFIFIFKCSSAVFIEVFCRPNHIVHIICMKKKKKESSVFRPVIWFTGEVSATFTHRSRPLSRLIKAWSHIYSGLIAGRKKKIPGYTCRVPQQPWTAAEFLSLFTSWGSQRNLVLIDQLINLFPPLPCAHKPQRNLSRLLTSPGWMLSCHPRRRVALQPPPRRLPTIHSPAESHEGLQRHPMMSPPFCA